MQNEFEWKRWYDERPTDHTLTYRWRVPAREICGLVLRPEWSGKLTLCGMGYGEHEYWPDCSRWDGYNRTVEPNLEWRLANDDEVDVAWNGFDLLPDPWTGNPPCVTFNTSWIHAPVYEVESFGLKFAMGRTLGWTNAKKLQEAWNTRHSS